MKLLPVIILCSLSFSLFTQTHGNFTIQEDRQVIWQKVYETNLSVDQQMEAVKTSGIFAGQIIETDGSLSGQTIGFENDFRGAGYSYMNTPTYISRMRTSGSVTYQFKEGRYRVTFSNVRFTQEFSDPLTPMGQVNELYDFAARGKKNQVFRDMFTGAASSILEHTFSTKFELRQSQNVALSDDW